MFRSFIFAVFFTFNSTTFAADAANKVTLQVQGMTCAACPITVKKVLQKVAGAAEVTVDYKSGTAEVRYDPKKVNPEELAKATNEAGFPTTVKEVR